MAAADCEVWFYHLERTGLDEVLPALLEKVLARGWRALIWSSDRSRIAHLDSWLWAYREDAFLAHGLADEPHVERQPVLLTTAADNLNAANVLLLLDDAEPGDLETVERCILLFDGRDEAAVARAREQWTRFKAMGLATSYWRQKAAGGWERAA